MKNFHRWRDEDLTTLRRPGLCFQDAYIGTADGGLKQYQKDPRHGCYLGIPCCLTYRASDDIRKRYAQIMFSSFAGGDGLRVLLDQCSLVVAGVRQPDVLHVVAGSGHDGKTLIFVDHMRAVFGSGFGCCPCSMLQVEREFQQQGLNFLHCAYMVFDESKRDHGIIEDQVKLFVGGGPMPLRRNHEADTKYGQWPHTGKVWNMNVGDIPHVPTAQERSHARRYRCTYMRSRFSNLLTEVNVKEKVFPADPSAKAFMASSDAVWRFYHDFLFPHIKAQGLVKCSDNLEFVKSESVTAKDTAWLLSRMARSSDHLSPDVSNEGSAEAPAVVQREKSYEELVRDTHRLLTQPFFSSVRGPMLGKLDGLSRAEIEIELQAAI